jgi:hypothetical protein
MAFLIYFGDNTRRQLVLVKSKLPNPSAVVVFKYFIQRLSSPTILFSTVQSDIAEKKKRRRDNLL